MSSQSQTNIHLKLIASKRLVHVVTTCPQHLAIGILIYQASSSSRTWQACEIHELTPNPPSNILSPAFCWLRVENLCPRRCQSVSATHFMMLADKMVIDGSYCHGMPWDLVDWIHDDSFFDHQQETKFVFENWCTFQLHVQLIFTLLIFVHCDLDWHQVKRFGKELQWLTFWCLDVYWYHKLLPKEHYNYNYHNRYHKFTRIS